MLAIDVAKAAQPVIERGEGGGDEDTPDEDGGGVEVQPSIAAVFDDEGPVWPDEAAESAMRAEVTSRGETLNSKAAREAAEAAAEAAAEKKNLPKLDALVERIPAEVRDTLEELFRVKFVKVARTPKKALKE